MKSFFKKSFAVILCAFMLFGIVGTGGSASDIFGTISAEAENDTAFKTGDLIAFGSYPQSKVTDSALREKLEAQPKEWVSYGYYTGEDNNYDGSMKAGDYMKYADISYNGEKFMAVSIKLYRPYYTGLAAGEYDGSSNQVYNGYEIGKTYYFLYEPLKWRVLDPEEGLVMCENLIDSQPFNNYTLWNDVNSDGQYDEKDYYFGDSSRTYYADNYAKSSIRQWLTDDFYNTAFGSEEKENIEISPLDNSAYSSQYSEYDSAATYDKVFLLSYSDVMNEKYGFSSMDTGDPEREASGTDYAECQGLTAVDGEPTNGCSKWRLRTPGYTAEYACYVTEKGYVSNGYYYRTYFTDLGIRPAMKLITLKNDSTGSKPEESSTYSVTWFSDGKFLSSAEYKAGDTIVKPADPVRSGDTFFGWSPDVPSTMPAKSLTFTAVFDSEKFDNTVIYTSDGSVDYRTKTTFTATATGIPTGYYLAIYGAQDKPITGTNTEVTANLGELKGNKTLTVKIVDSNGNVQTAANGSEISKTATVSVNSGFFKKIIAFFRGLFNRLPSVTIKP